MPVILENGPDGQAADPQGHIYDMIIVGGGPGGYTAALYAARAGLDAVVLERMAAGGQMALTEQVDNYPGFDEGVDGFTLGEKMRRGAERFGVSTRMVEAEGLDLSGAVKRVDTAEGPLLGRTVVLSTGAAPRKLELPGEEELAGQGVHYCAACDGMFYRGKTVAVVGGGNSAAGEALYLSRLCETVYLIHRRDALAASPGYLPQLQAAGVKLLWNSRVTGLVRQEQLLSGLEVEDIPSGTRQTLACQGLFVAIGREPDTQLVRGQINLDEKGYILAGEDTKTSLPGVFAVGDARQKPLRQIVTATADGAVAAWAAEQYLAQAE